MINNVYSKLKQTIGQNVLSKLNKISGAIVIIGTGNFGRAVNKLLASHDKVKVVCFCSSFEPTVSELEGLPVFSLSEAYARYKDAFYLICSESFRSIVLDIKKDQRYRELKICNDGNLDFYILLQGYVEAALLEENPQRMNFSLSYIFNNVKYVNELYESGRLERDVCDFESVLIDEDSKTLLRSRIKSFLSGDASSYFSIPVDKKQYFSPAIINADSIQCFFDCGAFTGDTIINFYKETKGRYSQIVAFEPSNCNYLRLKEFIESSKTFFHNVKLVNSGVGEDNSRLSFIDDGSGSHVLDALPSSDRNEKIEDILIEKIDNYIDYAPSYIKMDVEGFELAALRGAKETIRRYQPCLAICLYHKPEDVFEIYKYILSLVPSYRFKLRKHMDYFLEFVLYAFPRR